MIIEILLFLVTLGADQLLKYWTRMQIVVPGDTRPLLGNVLAFQYAQNFGTPDQVSFIRGRSVFMNIVRLLQVVFIVYLLVFQRKKLARITRLGLILFLSGLIGNQIDYFVRGFVTDMFYVPFWSRSPIFNVADVCVLVGMAIILVRVAFFEGQEWMNHVFEKKEKKNEEFGK